MMPLISSAKERDNSNASRKKLISSSVTRLPSSLGYLINPKAVSAQIETKHKVTTNKNINKALNILTQTLSLKEKVTQHKIKNTRSLERISDEGVPNERPLSRNINFLDFTGSH